MEFRCNYTIEKKMLFCEKCCEEVSDERDLFEFVDFMVCEDCLEMFLNGPKEPDEMDELAEELGNMNTK